MDYRNNYMNDFVGFNNYDKLSTNFTANVIIQLVEEHFSDLCGKNNFTITQLSSNDMTIIWRIELLNIFTNDNNLQLYTWKPVKNSILFHLHFIKSNNNEPNIVKFKNQSTIAQNYSEEKIFTLMYFISRKEKLCMLRYLEREPMLLFLNGCVTNYDNYSAEDFILINVEKTKSNIRRVLENPWMQREILEYIDYVRPNTYHRLLNKQFNNNK